MGGFVIKVEGLEKTLARFNGKNYEPQIQAAFDKFGVRVETEAKTLAPVDEGLLRNSMFSIPDKLGVIVGCSVNYAAYLEFGTRRFAAEYVSTLPATWRELAATTRGGGGGTFNQFVERLTLWVIRKGFAADVTASGNRSKSVSSIARQHQVAYLIARKILREGIRPHPFLYPAVQSQTPRLLEDLKAIKI